MEVQFRAVNPSARSLPQDAVEAIQEQIDRGALAVGDRLPPERVLREQLQVSRPALREALSVLEANGLLASHVGRGRVVAAPDQNQSVALVRNWLRAHRSEIEHMNEIRRGTECIAIEGADPDTLIACIPKLTKIIEEQAAAIAADDFDRASQLDCDFHLSLCSASPNQPLLALIRALIDSAHTTGVAVYHVPTAAQESLREHREIIHKLANGDVAGVRTALDRHHKQAALRAMKAGPEDA